VLRNTVFLSSANIFARAVGFFYFIFLGRTLGVENFGHYNFALALVYNFYPVADFGLERLILRDLSKNGEKAQDYFQKILPLRFSLALTSVFLVSLLGLFLSKNNFDRLNIFVFSLCLLPWTFNQLIAGIANAFEKMEIQSLAVVGMSLLTAILGGTVAFFGDSVTQILLAAFLANFLVSLIMFRIAGKIGLEFKIEIDKNFWKKALSESWVFATIMILAVFYLRASTVMVNLFKGPYFTGLYSSAFKFIEASILIPQSFALALFPQTARLLAADKESLKRNYLKLKSLGLIFLFSLVFCLVFYFFSPFILKIAYGEKYLGAVGAAKILGVAAIFFFMNALPGNVIQNSPRVKNFLPFAFANLVLVVIFGGIFIPRWSVEGAAIAVLLAEIFGFLVNNGFVWKILNEKS